jgi:hypothetical protein
VSVVLLIQSAQKCGEGETLYCFLTNTVFTHKNLLFLPSIFARVAELVDLPLPAGRRAGFKVNLTSLV